MFGEIFILKAYIYDFLTLEGFISFLVAILIFLMEDGTAEVVVGGGTVTESRAEVDTGGVIFSFEFGIIFSFKADSELFMFLFSL